MNCKNALSRLSAFQDEELSDLPARELELHLEACAACRREWQERQALVESLRRLSRSAPDAGFSSRIMAGLRKQPETKYRLLPSLAYTLALLAIFISGFLLEISANGQITTAPQGAKTFSAVLAESRNLGLLDVQESTLLLILPSMASGGHHEK